MFGFIATTVVVALLIDAFNDSAGESKRNWDEKYQEVKSDIDYHKRNIRNHIEDVQHSYDFHKLVNLHYSSVKVANDAYLLFKDSKKALDTIGTTLVETKNKINELYNKRNYSYDLEEKRLLLNDITELKKLREQLFPEKDTLKSQKNEFYNSLTELNTQTRNLKLAIKDKTGSKGREWFNKLENRKRYN